MQNIKFKQQTDIIVIDLSKSFYTVPHEKLLLKLCKYGINGCANNWILSFLMRSRQQAIVDGEFSDNSYEKESQSSLSN